MIEPQAPEKDQRYVEPMILAYGRDPKTGIPGLMCSSDNGQTWKYEYGPDGKKYDETDAKRIMKVIAAPLQELIAQEVQKALAAQNGGETN